MRIVVDAVSGRKTVASPLRRREGKPRLACRNTFTVWLAEPTCANVAKWSLV
jgi:hypothetical protein